jgi:hypothetical protein
MTVIVAVDMLVGVTATFRCFMPRLYLITMHFEATRNPTQVLARAANHRGFSLGHRTSLSAPTPRHVIWPLLPESSSSDGHRAAPSIIVTRRLLADSNPAYRSLSQRGLQQ